jgi:hypothetical protein
MQSRTFCVLVGCIKTQKLDFIKLILPVVLHGYKTLPLTLREEHKLDVFENRVLKRIFGPKMNVVAGLWRKLHDRILVICTLPQI